MKLFSKIILIAMLFTAFISCHRKSPGYSIIPFLEFKEMIRYSNGDAKLRFNFKDGDADVGKPAEEGNSFFFRWQVKVGNNWRDTLAEYSYPVPVMNTIPG